MRKKQIVQLALVGLVSAIGSQAYAGLNASDHSNWTEDYGYYFGATPPASAVEFGPASGFGAPYNNDGRVISNAAITQNTVDGTVLKTITTNLFIQNDVNLYKIQITDPATFSASVGNASTVLALFAADGTALAASIGGSANAITGSFVPAAGQYYIGLGVQGAYPQNAAGQNLFGLAGGFTGVTGPASLADLKLGTDPTTAWTLPGAGAANLIGGSIFSVPTSTITLAGANFSVVVPEPSVLVLLAVGGLLSQARRRRQAQLQPA